RVAIGVFHCQRPRGEQHGALTPIRRFIDHAPLLLEQIEGAGPVTVAAARLEHGRAGPAERWGDAGGLLRIGASATGIVAALRLDEEAMQPERLGVGPRGHGPERALRRVAIAAELCGLRAQ